VIWCTGRAGYAMQPASAPSVYDGRELGGVEGDELKWERVQLFVRLRMDRSCTEIPILRRSPSAKARARHSAVAPGTVG
jgi:hypothetical protein